MSVTLNKKELNDLVEHAEGKNLFEKTQNAADVLIEDLKKRDLKGEDFSIRELARRFITDHNGNPMGDYFMQDNTNLSEHNANIASLDTFSKINGQIFYNRAIDVELAELTVHRLFDVIPSTVIDRPEQFAGVSMINDETNLEVEDGQPLKMAGPTQVFTQAPRQRAHGLMTGVTVAEATADRTGQILRRMDSVAAAIMRHREKIAIDVLIDAASQVGARYNYKSTALGTFTTAATNFGAKNDIATNGLVDHTNLNTAYVSLATMTEPESGEPLQTIGDYTLLVSPKNAYTAKRLEVVTELRTGTVSTNNSILITQGQQDSSPAPFGTVVSKYLTGRLSADSQTSDGTTWYFGDIKKAYAIVRSADTSVQEAVPLTGTLFSNLLFGLWRCWYMEAPFCWNPRYITRNTA